MHQEVEIEFKNLITKEEYNKLFQHYQLQQEDIMRQTNFYFDTIHMDLKNCQSALRIRKKDQTYTITLKEPHPQGLLETHQSCSLEEVNKAIQEGTLPDGDVLTQIRGLLKKENIHFSFLGELATERAEIALPEGLLVLDTSYYFHVVDYEMEFECTDRKIGETAFHNILSSFRIPVRSTPNKIKRFYTVKTKLNNATSSDWGEYREGKLDK